MRRYPRSDLEKRFLEFVDKSGSCWEWRGSSKPNGHGQFYVRGKVVYVHRFAWEIRHGKIPKGHLVLRRCRNIRCVRPGHIYLDTCSGVRGNRHGKAKLNDKQVLDIVKLLERGRTQAEISEYYDVSKSCIGCIARGETWSHVTGRTRQ